MFLATFGFTVRNVSGLMTDVNRRNMVTVKDFRAKSNLITPVRDKMNGATVENRTANPTRATLELKTFSFFSTVL